MKFRCFYQTSDNQNRDEWIEARDRNDAYAQLKARGIRPYRVVGRDPRRMSSWAMTLVILAALLVVGVPFVVQLVNPQSDDAQSLTLPRAQIYGDSEILQKCECAGWRNVFPDEGDAWLARHARPGVPCDCPNLNPQRATLNVQFSTPEESDCEEFVKMKRMVNGMKEELSAYLAAGGTVADYRALCDERLRTEEGVEARIAEEFDRLRVQSEKMTRDAFVAEWEKKNRSLRALGLPTKLIPAEFL